MYFQYRDGKIICDNVRPDEQNKKFWEAKEYDKVFHEWREGDVLFIGENPILYPIEENGEIREMTREEKILLLEEIDLLVDGEYLENGEIKEIKYIKELGYYRPTWDKELHIWEEGTTREEFIEMRKNKILEYSKLEEEKKIFENTKFPSENEVEVIIEKMAILEADINNLAEKIKAL